MIQIVFSALAPAACIVVSAIPLLWYKFDKLAKIRVELDERNAADAEEKGDSL